jgi:exodeoxyribonuclease VII large subunit
MKDKLLLSELNNQIRDAILEAFPETVWVVAEISELKENRSGHCYLELIEKDEATDEITARARATIWSYTFRMLKPYFETTTGQVFTSGIKVLVQATVEFHAAFGLSLNIKDIDPTYTIGDLARKRREIIDRLIREGVFDMNKELPLPEVPQKIAVISSATAAGYLDFVNQLENNQHGFVFYHKLFEAYMQGTEATPSIINALERIFKYDNFFDVVVIIRGGGAQADLSCFDNYDLAINVTQFPLPVLTGIGHEKDDTIVDMVAHTRLKTPTAVAEFIISGALRFYENLIELEETILDKVQEILEEETLFLNRIGSEIAREGQFFILSKNKELTKLSRDFESGVHDFSFRKNFQLNHFRNKTSTDSVIFLLNAGNKLRQNFHDVKNHSEFVILKSKNAVNYLSGNFKNTVYNFLQNSNSEIRLKEKSVQLLNPENVLERGYTLTYKNGKIVKSSVGLKEKDVLLTRFADGKVESEIIKSK